LWYPPTSAAAAAVGRPNPNEERKRTRLKKESVSTWNLFLDSPDGARNSTQTFHGIRQIIFFFKSTFSNRKEVCYRLYFRIKKAFSKFTGIKKATLDTRGGELCIGK
jgi:hypothetical protein